MRIVIAVSGTRGDVQPAVVLGAELRSRGHDVLMAVPPNLVSFAASAGLETTGFGYDTFDHMNSDLVRHGLRRGSVADRLGALRQLWNYGWDQMVRELTAATADGVDVIVTGVTTEQAALPLVERHGASLIALQHAPIRRNGVHSPVPGTDAFPGPVLEAAWSMVDHLVWLATRRRENGLRTALGVPTAGSPLPYRIARYGMEIQAYDPAFCPQLASRWGERRPFCGFLDLDADLRARVDPSTRTDSAVLEWIAAGPPPVYVGFGSMPVSDPAALVTMVDSVCGRLGHRALVSVGWNESVTWPPEGGDEETTMVTGSLDHSRIFPLCGAVVHHGGAGSTAAGIRAGRPTLVCSVSSDQPFWGARIADRGAGAATTLAGLDDESFESGLRRIMTDDCARAAQDLAAEMIGPAEARARAADLVEASRP